MHTCEREYSLSLPLSLSLSHLFNRLIGRHRNRALVATSSIVFFFYSLFPSFFLRISLFPSRCVSVSLSPPLSFSLLLATIYCAPITSLSELSRRLRVFVSEIDSWDHSGPKQPRHEESSFPSTSRALLLVVSLQLLRL